MFQFIFAIQSQTTYNIYLSTYDGKIHGSALRDIVMNLKSNKIETSWPIHPKLNIKFHDFSSNVYKISLKTVQILQISKIPWKMFKLERSHTERSRFNCFRK